jgi:ubiquinone biosynthesis protein
MPAADILPRGTIRDEFDLPEHLPPFPRNITETQEWLSRWDEGRWGFWATLKLVAPLALRTLRRRFTSRSWRRQSWAEFRGFLESLGGLWIEVGLLLGKRPDLLGCEAQEEMALLRPPYNAFPLEVTELLFLKQFGRSMEEAFSQFNPQPISIGVFSQTYRACLRGPEVEVSVKVLRPDVAALLSRDLGILHTIIRASRWFGFARRFGLAKLEWEVRQWLIHASDLRYQAASMRRLRKTLKRHEVYVPRLYDRASSSHFLTAEFIDAPTLADLQSLYAINPEEATAWMERNRVRLRKLGRRVFQSFLRQVFVDNLLHSDLSPANIILFQDSCFAVPTSGPVASLDKQFATYQAHMFRAIANSDYSKAVDYLFLTCDSLPRVGLSELRLELVRLYRAFEMRSELRGVTFAERSFSALSTEISALMFRRGVVRSWQGVNLDRGWTNIEQSLHFLNPEFSLRDELQRYFKKADLSNAAVFGKEGIRVKISRLIASVSEQAMFIGTQLRRRAQALEGVSKAAYVGAVFFRALYRIVQIVIVGVLIAHYGLHEHLRLLRNTSFTRFAAWVHQFTRIEIYTIVILGIYAMFVLRSVVRRLSQRERK